MKSIYSFLASLLVMAATASAQSATVPNFISYQGRVVDASGAPVGAGTPVNRTVIFRIWDHPSNVLTGNLIYSESQVVTISNGEFSALVGQGVDNVNQTFGYAEGTKKLADLVTAFSGSNRYLGVTVATGGTVSAADKEITPRQQIVATPFAMRASVAEFAQSIMSSSDLTLNPPTGTSNEYGLGWYGSGRPFSSVAIDGPVLYGKAGGALGSNNSGTQKTALRWDATGRVGIGATSITSTTNKLTLQGDMGTTPADQLTIRGNANNNERLLLGYDTSANRASLQSYTAASTTGSLLLNPSGGNVGINKIAPAVALDVTGSIAASGGIAANGNNGYRFTTNDLDGGLFSPANGVVTIKTGGTERLRVDSFGDITTSRHISAAGNITAAQVISQGRVMTKSVEYWGSLPRFGSLFQSGLGAFPTSTSATVGEMVLLGSPRLHLATANGGAAVMTLSGNNVGIGTATPTKAKLQVEGSLATDVSAGVMYTKVGAGPNPAGGRDVSIYAQHVIWTGAEVVVSSDKRIKNISGVSDGASDLRTLMGIEVTNYSHKDVISKGKAEQKKVVAQQVETVFPQAVSKQTNAVPDIYQKAPTDKGWLQLATDLKKGERVKLIGDNEQGIYEVLEVGAGKFRTDFKPTDAVVFVYGREVDDFRTVDYDAIAMLNVSATQQLARELKLVQDENAALRRELAAKTETLEARLIALEQGLSGAGAVTLPISVQKADAAQ